MPDLTILQRVHYLATTPPPADVCRAVATIARKLASDDDAATKAHAITGTLRIFGEGAQLHIVAAIEELLP